MTTCQISIYNFLFYVIYFTKFLLFSEELIETLTFILWRMDYT